MGWRGPGIASMASAAPAAAARHGARFGQDQNEDAAYLSLPQLPKGRRVLGKETPASICGSVSRCIFYTGTWYDPILNQFKAAVYLQCPVLIDFL
jgi:hypothetical protein